MHGHTPQQSEVERHSAMIARETMVRRGYKYHSFILSLCVTITAFLLFDNEVFLEKFALKSAPTPVLMAANSDAEKHPQTEARPIFFLHVGPHKTGTTTIQDSFDSNPALRSDNYTFLGMRNPPSERDTFGVRAGLRQFRKVQSNIFLNKLGEVIHKENAGNFIVSTEDFSLTLSAVNKNGVNFFTLLANSLEGWDIHVAVGYRRHYDWLSSLYNQRHKNKNHRQSFVDWYRHAKHIQQGHGKDCFLAYSKMKQHFETVSVINMHSPCDLMTNVYCNILPNATNACAWYKEKLESEVMEDAHANPSVPVWPMTVAEEAKYRGFRSARQVDIKDRIMKYANEINYTLPLECVTPREEQEILETSLRYEKAMVPEFFASPLGEQELRNGFEKAVKDKKLCSVNTTHVFQDEQWLRFFNAATLDRV